MDWVVSLSDLQQLVWTEVNLTNRTTPLGESVGVQRMSTARPNQEFVPGRFTGGILGGLFCVMTMGLMAVSSVSAQEPSNSLQNIEVQALPGNRIELQLILSNPATEPLAFTIDQPARIAPSWRLGAGLAFARVVARREGAR